MSDIKNAILDYIKNEYLEEEDEDDIDFDTPLISGGIVDSFSMVSLKVFLEVTYKIQLPDSKATPEAFDSVNNIYELLNEFNVQ